MCSRSFDAALERGSHSSQRGRYQFQSPSNFIVAGSSTPRMIVASISTATARPTPICLMSSVAQRGEDREDGDHHGGGAGEIEAVVRMPRATASSVGMPVVDELFDAAEDEDVVVDREPEEDGEQEQRQPGGRSRRSSGSRAAPCRCPSWKIETSTP